MDECIGCVMPLSTLLKQIPDALTRDGTIGSYAAVMYELASILFETESVRTWILRPSMKAALPALYAAYVEGNIDGAFLFSNNANMELVNFMSFFLNVCIWKTRASGRPVVFRMTAWDKAPWRTSSLKNFQAVLACFAAHHIPPCSPDELLYFDDQLHSLSKEIRHYVQVPPYRHASSIRCLLTESLSSFFSRSSWFLLEHAVLIENAAMLRSYSPPADEGDVFCEAIRVFLEEKEKEKGKEKEER